MGTNPGEKEKSQVPSFTAPKTKKNATPKQTGGGGGIFEEKVIAYFLADLLTGDAPLELPKGKILQVETQRPASIWQLDDLLLKIEGLSETHKVAFSIKSNGQITANGFPADFVRAVWTQILQIQSTNFNPETDFVGFITTPLGAKLSESINTLLNRALQQNPDTLASEILIPGVANEQIRKLFDSFKCPSDLAAQRTVEETATGRVLKRLIWLTFDFEVNQSKQKSQVQSRLRGSLVSNKTEEADLLWEALCKIARDMRPQAGSRTQPQLAEELRYQFQLGAYPDHRSDWIRVKRAVESTIQRVTHLIGGQLVLPRVTERKALGVSLGETSALVLRGDSGTGKSVLARMEAITRLDQGEPVIWIDAEELRGKTLKGLSHEWGLLDDLSVLLTHNTARRGLCVIDRLDKIYDNTFGVVAELLGLLKLQDSTSRWQLLLPCVEDEWERIKSKFLEYGLPQTLFKLFDIGILTRDDQEIIWHTFPQLIPFRLRPHLNDVLLRPKMLDILARSITNGQGLDELVGETSVAKLWIINLEQQGSTIKQLSYAQLLAVIQADTWQNSLPAALLPELNIEAVEELVKQRVLVKQAGSVWFEHDLLGDWLRLEKLRGESKKGNLVAFLSSQERITSPLWQRAVRLLGIALLDENNDTSPWSQTFEQFGTAKFKELAQNLLLEATWAAADSPGRIVSLWPLLVADEGEVLQRLLMQFLHRATRPNERIMAIMAKENPVFLQDAATWHRIPIMPFWPPLLNILHSQRQNLPLLSWTKISKIAQTWLEWTSPGAMYRYEAATLAVVLGELFLKKLQNQDSEVYELGKYIWPAVLLAATERPNEVEQLVLEAAGRRPARFLPPSKTNEGGGMSITLQLYGPPRPQWPDGPAKRVDKDLQKAALVNEGMYSLINTYPELAKELALALLIDEPKSPNLDGFKISFGLVDLDDWKGAHYQNGPFLQFLRYNEEMGVDLVLRLERRAITAWYEKLDNSSNSNSTEEDFSQTLIKPTIWLDMPKNPREFVGDQKVYGWHRGAHPSCVIMTSALMALEKHLYDRVDEGNDLTNLLQNLLSQAESVAILGTLAQVGKYKPDLLNGVLQPLFGVPELLLWDELITERINHLDGGVISGILASPARRKLLYEWHALAHRKISLQNIAIQWFIRYSKIRPFFDKARKQWQERLSKTTIPDFYETCLSQFNLKNYEIKQISSTHKSYQYREPPERQSAHDEWLYNQRINNLLLSTGLKNDLIDKADTGEIAHEELETFWEEIRLLESLSEDKWVGRTPFGAPIDVVASIAALYIIRGQKWLAKNQDQSSWCEDFLLSGAKAVWEEREQNNVINNTISGLHWEDFVAKGLGALWAQRPGDKIVRHAVGQVVLSGSIFSLRGLINQAYPHRLKLGDDYFRMAHLLMLRASQWYKRILPNGKQPGAQNAKKLKSTIQLLNTELEVWLAKFIEGNLSHYLPPLHKLVEFEGRKRQKQSQTVGYQGREPRWHPFNEEIMKTVHSGLPSPVDEPKWLPYWHQLMDDTVARLQPFPEEEDQELAGYPREWDMWLFEKVTSWLPHMEPTLARQLWEPVLALGPSARSWVEFFLHNWAQIIFRDPNNNFGKQTWLNMVAYAQSSARWDLIKGSKRYRRGELWRALLALDWFSTWEVKHKGLAEMLGPALQIWAMQAAVEASSAKALATFLVSDAAIKLRIEGLGWLACAEQVALPNSYWLKEVADSLASLLGLVWGKHQNMLRQNPLAFQTFKFFLASLVAQQHPLSLELNVQVGEA